MQGKSFFVRLRAMNVCGWSDYSSWNDIIHTYIYTYIHVLNIYACINSYIKMMKEKIIELFGVVI